MVHTMMKTLRGLLIAWMVAWLPLSGAIALTMPYARAVHHMDGAAADVAQQTQWSMPCHEAGAADSAPQSPSPDVCVHCDLCHLASALIAPAVLGVQPDLVRAPESASANPVFASHIPDLPQRPPRSASF